MACLLRLPTFNLRWVLVTFLGAHQLAESSRDFSQ